MPQHLSSTDRLFLALIASLSDDDKEFLLNTLREINGGVTEVSLEVNVNERKETP